MRARVIFVVTIFFAMLAVTAVGNPILPVVPGPFVPGPGGEISFVAEPCCSLSTLIIGAETLAVDTIIERDSTDLFGMEFVYRFNPDTLFPEEGSEFTIWFSYSSDMWFYEWPESLCVGLSPDFFDHQFYFGPWLSYRIPIAPEGYYWRMVYLNYYSDGTWWQYQLNSLPIDYNLPVFPGETFHFSEYIRINEVKAYGADRFIEIAKFSDDTISLDGWHLLSDEGMHDFTAADTLVDYFAIYESDWDSGFDLPDTCELMLISPEGNVWSMLAWHPWSTRSYSANVYVSPDSFWVDTVYVAIPTPGAVNYLSIEEKPNSPLPSAVSILSAQPNPFNSSATIGYELAKGVSSATMDIFDINGRLIRSRDLSDTRSGYHETKISALPASGTYLVRIETNRGSDEMKITYLK